MTKMLNLSEAIARGDVPPPPIAQLIGFELISVKPGEAVVEFQATDWKAISDPATFNCLVNYAELN